MTTNNEGNANMWHYVRVEDYEDNANFHNWVATRTDWHIDDMIRDLNEEQKNPFMVCVRNVPALDTLWNRMYWIEYVSNYDEIETTEVLGFAYIPALIDDKEIERAFMKSFGSIV